MLNRWKTCCVVANRSRQLWLALADQSTFDVVADGRALSSQSRREELGRYPAANWRLHSPGSSDYGHPACGAGAFTAITRPVRVRSVVLSTPRHSRVTMNNVAPSGPPSMQAKQPRSDSTVWSISPPSRTRTQRLLGTSAYQTAFSASMQMPSGTPSRRSAHVLRFDKCPSAAMSNAG